MLLLRASSAYVDIILLVTIRRIGEDLSGNYTENRCTISTYLEIVAIQLPTVPSVVPYAPIDIEGQDGGLVCNKILSHRQMH